MKKQGIEEHAMNDYSFRSINTLPKRINGVNNKTKACFQAKQRVSS